MLQDNEEKSGRERNLQESAKIEDPPTPGVVSRQVAASQQRIVHQIVPVVLYGPKGKKKITAMLASASRRPCRPAGILWTDTTASPEQNKHR